MAGGPAGDTETAPIEGRAFLPRSSRPLPAQLRVAGNEVVLRDADGTVLARTGRPALRIEAPVGRAPRRIVFADGTLFETEARAAVDALAGRSFGTILHRAEALHPRLVLVVGACLLGAFLVWRYGLAALVAVAIWLTPQAFETAIDDGTMRSIDLTLAEPSALDRDARAGARAVFDDLLAALPAEARDDARFRLEFRDMPGLGPNAFALPGGTIVLTDALVAAFPDEDVIAGVLAHEIGHVVERHGLTQLYRSLGVFVLVSLIAGETGPVIEDILLEGNLLLSLSYSRRHERAADAFGVQLTQAAGYDPAGLLAFFVRLRREVGDGGGWLSTHPSNDARIEAIEEAIGTP